MRRATLAVALGLAFASYALPQDSAAQKQDAEQGDPWIWWTASRTTIPEVVDVA